MPVIRFLPRAAQANPLRPALRASRLRRLLRGGTLAFLLLSAALALFLLACLLIYPRPDWTRDLPLTCGARGDLFSIECVEDRPFLRSQGLPYPTAFDSTDHETLSLDGEWKMAVDSSGDGETRGLPASLGDEPFWQPITVPSTYNRPGGLHPGHQGVTWFLRTFPGPDTAAAFARRGHYARLGFDGVLLRSKVWMNGKLLGSREGGHTPFYFDATAHLRPGLNHLLVRADNRLTSASLPPKVRHRHNPVWGIYGGLYRSVRLEWIPRISVFKVAVNPLPASPARPAAFEVEAFWEAFRPQPGAESPLSLAPPAPCTLHVTLIDPAGRVAGRERRLLSAPAASVPAPASAVGLARFSFPLRDALPYEPGNPRLYSLRLALRPPEGPAQNLVVKTGYRTLAVTPSSFLYNGKPLFLRGISKMEDAPGLGQTQTDSLLRQDLGLIKALNANYIRLSHYAHALPAVLAARDSGLLLSEEIPFFHAGSGWSQWMVDFQGPRFFPFSLFGMKHLHDRRLFLNSQRELVELLERDRNNPAVILWYLANESYSLFAPAGRFYGRLAEIARAFDPSRPSTLAEMTYYLPLLDRFRRGSDSLAVASLNLYFGWYFGDTSQVVPHLREYRARYPGKPLLLSEFGAEAARGRKDEDGLFSGNRVFFPRTYSESYQAALLRFHVRHAARSSVLDPGQSEPFVIGVSPWCFADFYCPWFPRNPVPDYNNKGVVDRFRVPKGGYFALQEVYAELAAAEAGAGAGVRARAENK